MKKIILREAFEELNDAISYYEEQQSGLGRKLKEEVDLHIQWISEHAEIARIRRAGYRHVNLKIFPYYIAYITRKDTLGFLLLHIVIVNLNIGLKEKTRPDNNANYIAQPRVGRIIGFTCSA